MQKKILIEAVDILLQHTKLGEFQRQTIKSILEGHIPEDRVINMHIDSLVPPTVLFAFNNAAPERVSGLAQKWNEEMAALITRTINNIGFGSGASVVYPFRRAPEFTSAGDGEINLGRPKSHVPFPGSGDSILGGTEKKATNGEAKQSRPYAETRISVDKEPFNGATETVKETKLNGGKTLTKDPGVDFLKAMALVKMGNSMARAGWIKGQLVHLHTDGSICSHDGKGAVVQAAFHVADIQATDWVIVY